MKRLTLVQRIIRAAYSRFVVTKFYPLHATWAEVRIGGQASLALKFTINPTRIGPADDAREGVLFQMALSDEQAALLVQYGQRLLEKRS